MLKLTFMNLSVQVSHCTPLLFNVKTRYSSDETIVVYCRFPGGASRLLQMSNENIQRTSSHFLNFPGPKFTYQMNPV